MSERSIFTKIVDGDIPSEKLHDDEHCIVIKDISPQAPTHVLIIPKKPIPKLADAQLEDKALLGHLMWVAGEMSRRLGVDEAFRLVVNNGADAGQTVFHLHLHLMANRTFTEGDMAL